MPSVTRRLAASACLVSLLATPPLALARSKSSEGKPKKTRGSARGVRLKPGPQTNYANGDTPAERQRYEDARLRRECQGRPNAGACLGYAR